MNAAIDKVLEPGEEVVLVRASDGNGASLAASDRRIFAWRWGRLEKLGYGTYLKLFRGEPEPDSWAGITRKLALAWDARRAATAREAGPSTASRMADGLRESLGAGGRLLRREDPLLVPDEDPTASLRELETTTLGWTLPTVVRTYRDDHHGLSRLSAETQELAAHGYAAASSFETKGKVKSASLFLTGGVGAAVNYARGTGGIHEVGTRTVSFTLASRPQADIRQQLRDLEDLKAEGLVTDEEYESKRVEILARL